MGACDFMTSAKGKDAKEAFRNAVDEARYEHGHGGYTGTIAEKDSFKMICSATTMAEGYAEAERLISAGDSRIDDKWGPAGCIEVGEGAEREFIFFGVASS
jgi:hypothetical protein